METYCSKSWTDINIDFELRELRHCCKARPYQFPDVLTEEFISRGPGIQERRQQSLINIAHRDCDHCWNDYAKGNSAYKDWANKWDNDYIEKHRQYLNDDRFVYYVEIKTDNTCDLACLYCSPNSSSKIAQEENIPIISKTKEHDYEVFKSWIKKFLAQEHLVNHQIIFIFLGGEPTASAKFYELVDFIDDCANNTNKNIRLEICTNANSKRFLMDKIMAKMDTSRLTWGIGISNESFGSDAELIRHGLSWSRFQENFKRYIRHTKTELIVMSPAINIFNLKSFASYVDWVHNQFRIYAPYKKFTWHGNYISWPDSLDIAILPKEYVKYVEQVEQTVFDNVGGIVYDYREGFVEYLTQMKTRIGSNYNPDYKKVAEEFLLQKQQVKKTDQLMRLMNNLDL